MKKGSYSHEIQETCLFKQDPNNDNTSCSASLDGGNLMGPTLTQKELYTIHDCIDSENYSSPGMSFLNGYPIPSGQPPQKHTYNQH